MKRPRKTVNADYQAAIDQMMAHRNSEAQKWLSNFLKCVDWDTLENPSLWGFESDEPAKLPPRMQIAVLKSCIELMVYMRGKWGSSSPDLSLIRYYVGGVVYWVATDLFRRPLPFTERDICEILESTRHDCGHGGDVMPPFDLALAHARKHHLSARLLNALKVYVDRLKGLRSKLVQDVKRRAELLFTLDTTYGKQLCWSEQFREGLTHLPAQEQTAWRHLVVQMDAAEFARNKKQWKTKAPQLIETMGGDYILTSLSAWWPGLSKIPVPLETGGSYLLQHFVWLLEIIAQQRMHTKTCDSLVVRLSKLEWKPKERAQKVMVAATHYLEQRPPGISWAALQRLHHWSESVVHKAGGYSGSSISKVMNSYAEKHGLSPTTGPHQKHRARVRQNQRNT